MSPVIPLDKPAMTWRECSSCRGHDLKLAVLPLATQTPQTPESSSNLRLLIRASPLLHQTRLASKLRCLNKPMRRVEGCMVSDDTINNGILHQLYHTSLHLP
jgi:hypothetical protein